MRPVITADALLLLRSMNHVIGAADAPDLPTFRARGGRIPPEFYGSIWRHPFARLLLPSIERAALSGYQLATESRLAATSLAIRLYALDHDGQLPERLDDLVPRYLPAVPLDALAGNGKTIGYVNPVTDPDRPRIYHVGENLKDDKGRPPNPKLARAMDVRMSDEVVYLKHQPRPATQPGE